MNTYGGSVKGQLEGPSKEIEDMKHWLRNTGSPSSKIEKAEFSDLQEILKYSFNDFSIKK